MFVDARLIPHATVIETEVCIIGAGAAGITLARDFAAAAVRTILLEGGGMAFEPESQELYAGSEIGRPCLDPGISRLRFFGGTTNHWAGWCRPLDPIDFSERDGFPHHGWPFSRADLDPWYRRAHPVCQIGKYDYDPAAWGIAVEKIPAPFNGPAFATKVLQVSPPTRFGTTYEAELRAAPDLAVYLHANAVEFITDASGNAVNTVSVATLAGGRFAVRARIFVLATGAIENARLLLHSRSPAPGRNANGLGNAYDLVGRFFMTHLEFLSGMIAVSDPHADFDFNYDFNLTTDGRRPFVSFVAPSESRMQALRLQNMRITWEYHLAPVTQTLAASRRLLGGGGDRVLTDLGTVIRDLDGLAALTLRKLIFGQGMPVQALTLRCHAEQRPNPDSRITLGPERDPLGMPRIVLDWRLDAADRHSVDATHRLLGAEVGRTGFGRLRYDLAEDAGGWPDDMLGNAHSMGTTRMHRDPRRGVVDENCRVHGLSNLYVAGSSVFPTSGAANPTLTIVALALRLADHVRSLLR